ncbi:EF-hand calcium-binding domain-containing protein 7-like isoform X2 [Watersipora subatra]|uniref:EF-hand calcium-binding domain-containing protein 7-like isoform X2 n=1 Tax=Watersipora subatra TaxID=2589382 RepID=UPI00355C93EF
MSEKRINETSSKSFSGVSIHEGSSMSSDAVALEHKAAYISAVNGASIQTPLTSKSELLLALQNTGRNPTHKSLSKYWTSSTVEVKFEEFCKICEKERVTTEDDLMKAFKKIDANGDGFISHAELKKVMTTKGEKMSDEEVSKLIDEVDENKDGKLDYREFSNMVLNTSKQCKEKAMRKFEKTSASKTIEGNVSKERSLMNGDMEESRKKADSRISVSSEHGDKENVKEKDSRRESKLRVESHRAAREDGKESAREHEETRNGSKESKYSHRERKGSNSSVKERRSSISEGTESKRSVPRSPRLSPRVSPRVAKDAKSKDKAAKEKLGSQASLQSHDSRTANEDSPKPAPRHVNRQDIPKSAVSSLNLKLQAPKKLSNWKEEKRRGLFYLEENGEVLSTQYSLVIKKATSVWLTLTPCPSQSTAALDTPFDMSLLLLRSKPDRNGNLLVTSTERRDSSGKYGVRCDLEAGKYHLLATTSGCSLPLSTPSREPQKKIVKKKSNGAGDQYALTKEFKYVLTDIFNMVDTDMNGLLSREEFNQYSIRTGEDEIGDDEWDIVKENAELKKGELTCKGFMRLIELEAEDAEGDTEDLWVTLDALGYDSSLTQNQAYPFTLEVCLEGDAEHTLSPLPSLLSSRSKSLRMALKEVCTSKGELIPSENRSRAARSSGNDRDVGIYIYETETSAAVAIENKLPTRATVNLDCSASKNVKSNPKSLSQIFPVPATSFMVAYQMVPADERKEWQLSCVERDLLTAS